MAQNTHYFKKKKCSQDSLQMFLFQPTPFSLLSRTSFFPLYTSTDHTMTICEYTWWWAHEANYTKMLSSTSQHHSQKCIHTVVKRHCSGRWMMGMKLAQRTSESMFWMLRKLFIRLWFTVNVISRLNTHSFSGEKMSRIKEWRVWGGSGGQKQLTRDLTF